MRQLLYFIIAIIVGIGGAFAYIDSNKIFVTSVEDIELPPVEQRQSVQLIMSVAQAYRAIPHDRTIFEPSRVQLPQNEEAFLNTLFRLTDMAMVERVQTMQYLSTQQYGADRRNHTEIMYRIQELHAPQRLQRVHANILGAIKDQHDYFNRWRSQNNPNYFDRNDRLVRRASGKLHAAYNELLNIYPDADQYLRNAFFNHLCALDFL